MTRRAIILGLVLALGAPAAAAPIILPATNATLELGPSWRASPAAGVVASYRTEAGLVLAITRAQVPNIAAWRKKTRGAYLAQIERGVAAKIEAGSGGYRRTKQRLGDAHGVPVLDLEARRQDGATVVIRILLYRTYALSLAIEVPRRGDLARARAVAATFTPPPPT